MNECDCCERRGVLGVMVSEDRALSCVVCGAERSDWFPWDTCSCGECFEKCDCGSMEPPFKNSDRGTKCDECGTGRKMKYGVSEQMIAKNIANGMFHYTDLKSPNTICSGVGWMEVPDEKIADVVDWIIGERKKLSYINTPEKGITVSDGVRKESSQLN